MSHDPAVESAILAEIAERTRKMQVQQTEADAVTDLLFTEGEVPDEVPVRKAKLIQAPRHQMLELPEREINPNVGYVELPKAVQKFVQESTAAPDVSTDSTFRTAAEYFTRHAELIKLSREYPKVVPAPLGWESSNIKSGPVDVVDLLRNYHNVERHPDMLTDLIRWACTVQKAQAGRNVDATLRSLEARGVQNDEKLRDGAGALFLNKFRTIVSLMQTEAFRGEPEMLAELLIADWAWLEKGIAYKTPLSALEGSLNDSASMTAKGFAKAGSLSEFSALLKEKLVSEFRGTGALRDPEFDSISAGYLKKTGYLNAERTTLESESPVYITLGYQEQLAGGSSMDKDGYTESYANRDVLRIVVQDGEPIIEALPAQGSMSKACADAVRVLELLNEAGK